MITKKVISTFLAVFVIFGCEDLENLLKFNINHKTAFYISASPLNSPVEILTPDVTTNSQQQYENNNTHADLVKDVRLQQLKLSITNPDTKTFSFLKSIKIFISSDQNNEIELASLENIPADANTIELIPTQQKLDAYVKASSYNLRTQAVTRETLTESVDIQVDLKFVITANAF
jgi:hypothetical protein